MCVSRTCGHDRPAEPVAPRPAIRVVCAYRREASDGHSNTCNSRYQAVGTFSEPDSDPRFGVNTYTVYGGPGPWAAGCACDVRGADVPARPVANLARPERVRFVRCWQCGCHGPDVFGSTVGCRCGRAASGGSFGATYPEPTQPHDNPPALDQHAGPRCWTCYNVRGDGADCGCVECPSCERVDGPACEACGDGIECQCCTCDRCEACGTLTDGAGRRPSRCEHCERCPDCCECEHCTCCNHAVEHTCTNCERCDGCCECHTCQRSRCGERVSSDSYCSDCERCDSCCECHTCECGCRVGSDSWYCDDCDNCEDHCECTNCEGCDERHSDVCDDCNRCSGCGCECDSSDDCDDDEPTHRAGGSAFRCAGPTEPRFHAAGKGDGSRRFVSLEVELSGTGSDTSALRQWCRKWGSAAVKDGSLPATGCEINTAPAAGSAFVSQVRELCEALQTADASISDDCGVHVHVDARDFKHYEMRRLIRVYAMIENAVYAVVQPSRKNSSYCKPCAASQSACVRNGTPTRFDRKAVRKAIAQAAYGEANTRHRKAAKYDGARYAGLNLHSWFHRGTVELRMHGASTNREKLTFWGEFWAGVLDYCHGATDKQIDAIAARHGVKGDRLPDGNQSFAVLLELCRSDAMRSYFTRRREKFAGR